MSYLKAHDISLVRRSTGGGAVFHDLGNINFSYITQCEKTDFFNFERFASPVISALKALDLNVEATGRNDLTIDGCKISGNAQRLDHGRILHHGTLLFNSDFGYMQGALNADPRKLKGKGISSVRSRVTNISSHLTVPMTVESFINHLNRHILSYFDNITEYNLSSDDIAAINKLADQKYRNDNWNLWHMGKYSYSNSAVFRFGIVYIGFDVADGKISDIKISGDFFGTEDIGQLCAKIKGTVHTPDALADVFSSVDIGSYISGAEATDIIGLFF
jgi:lipoate-protein ligase A